MKKKDLGLEIDATFAGIHVADAFANRLLEQLYAPSPFQTDEMIEEVLPKYQFFIRVPYIRYDSEYQEVRVGLNHVVLFSWGKKKVQRRAYIWESKKDHGVLKIRRCGNLETDALQDDK